MRYLSAIVFLQRVVSWFLYNKYSTEYPYFNWLKIASLLKRLPGKVSNHGYINFKIRDYVKIIWKDKKEIVKIIEENNKNKLDNKQFNNSSSNIITTINKKEGNIDSENPWTSINIFPLETYGLKQSHLKQLEKMNCTTPEIVQESIHHMAYGLENTKDTQKYDYPISCFFNNSGC